jgi:hypothetical protein
MIIGLLFHCQIINDIGGNMKKTLFFIGQLIFFGCVVFGQVSQITLELKTTRGSHTLYVDSDTKELFFEKSFIKSISDTKELYFDKSSIESVSYIVTIQGLNKLYALETIVFDMTAFIKDFSFLEDVPHLKKAVFVLVHPSDWTFIKKLPNIEYLYIRSCATEYMRIDFINNKNLRYLEISNGSLVSYPELLNIPSLLEYLNLSFNKIKTIPEDRKNSMDFITILYATNVEHFESKSILFVHPKSILPSQYIINNVSH